MPETNDLDLHLIWTWAGKTLHGYDPAKSSVEDGVFSHGPLFPGTVTDLKTVFITSSCVFSHTEYFLYNLAVYIESDEETAKILAKLAAGGNGVQVSFDDAWTWQSLEFSPIYVDRKAVITNPQKGVLGPYDTLRLNFRVAIPPDFEYVGKLSYRIGIDFDVL